MYDDLFFCGRAMNDAVAWHCAMCIYIAKIAPLMNIYYISYICGSWLVSDCVMVGS